MKKIGSISIFPEEKGVLRMDDGKGSSFYLLEGSSAALLVDTGMATEPLRPVIEQLTEKPIVVLITHGHGDHISHAEEFDTVYLDSQDIAILRAGLERLGIRREISLSGVHNICNNDIIEAGDMLLRALNVGGHSPGSMVFYEPSRNILFTGDAVGSGCGVWMQLMGSLPITQYRKNLRLLIAFIKSLPDQPTIFSGHADQRYAIPGSDNPVCLALIEDMEALCTLILENKENRMDVPEAMIRENRPVYMATHGRATMVYSQNVIA